MQPSLLQVNLAIILLDMSCEELELGARDQSAVGPYSFSFECSHKKIGSL